MKRTCEKSENNRAASAESLVKSNDPQPPHITLSMIATELEKLEIEWQSLCATITTSSCGVLTKAKSLFTANR